MHQCTLDLFTLNAISGIITLQLLECNQLPSGDSNSASRHALHISLLYDNRLLKLVSL